MAGVAKRSGVALVLAVVLTAIGGSEARQWVPGDAAATPTGSLRWPIDSFPDNSNDSGFDMRPEDRSRDTWPVPVGTEAAAGTPPVTPAPVPGELAD